MLAARDGSVLTGTHSVLAILRNGHTTTIDAAQGLRGKGVTALLEDLAGRYWMGVGNQLVTYDGHRLTMIKRSDGQPAGIITALALDADGSVWATAAGTHGGLIHLTAGTIETVLPEVAQVLRLAADVRPGVWLVDRTRLGHYFNGQVQWTPLALKTAGARINGHRT